MSHRRSRRRFLKQSLALTAVGALAPRAIAANLQANQRLNLACVGVGGRGAAQVGAAARENLIGLCDVDANNLGAASAQHAGAKTFRDFRRMLDAIGDQLDGVLVSTPDHTHAPATLWSLDRGLAVYCEKPLTHEVAEIRRVMKAANEQGVATQMGTQIHAGDNYRRVVELVQAGAIGTVAESHVWVGGRRVVEGLPEETPPVPEYLDWDLWLGPAAWRPYSPAYHPFKWRAYRAFGNGTMGDMACHHIDLSAWALDLRYPETIEPVAGSPVDPEGCGYDLVVRYQFPARGDKPALTLTWYDGNQRPPQLAEHGLPDWGAGTLLIGSEGMLLADYGRRVLYPTEKFADYQPPEPSIPPSPGHHQEWFDAIRGGPPALCHFDYAGPLTETVLLGTVAYRAGTKLTWDVEAMRAVDCPEANALLDREYRPGWSV